MKKWILLGLTIFFIFFNLILKPIKINEPAVQNRAVQNTAVPDQAMQNQAVQAIDTPQTDYAFKILCSLKVNERNINILEKDNSIYITSTAQKAPDTAEMKEVTVNSASTSKIFVNIDNTLPKNYAPQNLTAINPSKVKLQYAGLKLIPRTLNALYDMVDAARTAGVKGFIINSAYRSISAQQQIFDSNLNSYKKTSKTYEEAFAKTRLLVALPGNSEHHTGLAIDIFSVNGLHRNDFEGTREQVWLNDNLHKYGFIIRYPKDKTKETNSTYEPWHIRYVGIPLSSYMKEENLCLEEFYSKVFADQIIEHDNYLFMRIKIGQKVFMDENLLPAPELEKVNTDNMLLTIKK